jgi:hypothetical protein
LRRIDPYRTPWLYVDNGSDEIEWSAHDNTAVSRWCLRENGMALAGPDPTTLVDPVSAEELRDEVRAVMRQRLAALSAEGPAALDNAWVQPHVVVTYCRMLHTLACGRVTSKRAAGEWARDQIDEQFRDLVQQALDQRADPWRWVHRPPDLRAVARTWEFMQYAVAQLDVGA